MPRRKPPVPASDHLRRAIASQAARLMAEDGIGDYGQAKRKAARQLGAGESEALPSNEEVAIELRAYQSLYQDDEQVERLRELRLAALEVMELLADFRPYLTGAVLDGTAGRYAEVEIELFADSAKDVEIYLLSRNISYEIAESRQQRPDAPETRLRIEWQDATILLSVFPYQVERRQRRSPHSGRQHDRARTADVAALLAS